jgi:hypothetical protein
MVELYAFQALRINKVKMGFGHLSDHQCVGFLLYFFILYSIWPFCGADEANAIYNGLSALSLCSN